MINQAFLSEADQTDILSSYRKEFYLPKDVIYLDGNSLGALPKKTFKRLEQVIREEWGDGLITSWIDCEWMKLPELIGDKIAALIGATPGEVVVCDSTSINLFKSLSAALTINSTRNVILSTTQNFPTDLYIAEGISRSQGRGVELRLVSDVAIEKTIDSDIAVVMMSHVDFRTGAMLNMERITNAAHDSGALVVWDLSHSAGIVPVNLNDCEVDFAVGCSYKYLNGGPGSPGYIFVSRLLQTKAYTPLQGWMGHDSPFEFSEIYRPAAGIGRFRCGSPPILSMAALEVGVNLVAMATVSLIREKSIRLTEYFIALLQQHSKELDFKILTPLDCKIRGGQVSVAHRAAADIVEMLKNRGIIVDYRTPNIIRFGFSPLYNRYSDLWQTKQGLLQVVGSLNK